MNRIGINVGGTNTDAVLLEDDRVRHAVKTPTTADVTSGVRTALANLLEQAGRSVAVDAVMIGTTHFTNAVVQRRDLAKVAAVRIGLPASASLPPFCDWPEDLAELVRGQVHMLEGGHEYDGRPIVPFDAAGMREVAMKIRDSDIRSVGIASIFSPLDGGCENEAESILRDVCPDVAVTVSHRLGRIGLLERENVTLLNACLRQLARATTQAFVDALSASGIQAPLYLTQNDGTVMLASEAEAYPVYSFASGPDEQHARRGVPLEALGRHRGRRGRYHHGHRQPAARIPARCQRRRRGRRRAHAVPHARPAVARPRRRQPGRRAADHGRAARAWATCSRARAACSGARSSRRRTWPWRPASSIWAIARRVADLSPALIRESLSVMHAMIEEAVDRMKTDASEVPLIVVGGGSFLVPERIPGVSEVVQVPHQAVANAVGAAIAQVSGEIDQVFQGLSRDQALAEAQRLAEAKAVRAGADPATLAVVEVEDLPLSYLPGNSLRVRLRVVGDIAKDDRDGASPDAKTRFRRRARGRGASSLRAPY